MDGARGAASVRVGTGATSGEVGAGSEQRNMESMVDMAGDQDEAELFLKQHHNH